MAERNQTRLWSMRAVFAAICLGAIFWRILPLDLVPRGWAGPDLIVALTFAWVLRRPEFAPALLIAALMLLSDLLFQRPVGLWAALVVVGAETLRARGPGLRDMSFAPEWLAVASVLVAITLGYRLVLSILLVPQAPLGLSLMETIMTLLAYPLVVLASALLLGVRKTRPGDDERIGSRT
jgi:rod shape-determining protein MreD